MFRALLYAAVLAVLPEPRRLALGRRIHAHYCQRERHLLGRLKAEWFKSPGAEYLLWVRTCMLCGAKRARGAAAQRGTTSPAE